LNRKADPSNDAPWVGLAEIHEYRANKSAAISALQKAKQILERGDKHSKTDNLQFVGIKLKQLMALTSHEAQMGRPTNRFTRMCHKRGFACFWHAGKLKGSDDASSRIDTGSHAPQHIHKKMKRHGRPDNKFTPYPIVL